jgi:formylmethanofuran dehydrogenase subunit D
MAKLNLTLITGRSTGQGTGISTGKEKEDYRNAVRFIDISRADMDRAGFREGDVIVLKAEFGSAEARCRCADVPEGIAFMALGSVCNRLVGTESSASGMPDLKHIPVEVVPIHSIENKPGSGRR